VPVPKGVVEARRQLETAAEVSALRLNDIAQREAALEQARREHEQDDPAVTAATAAAEQARQDLGQARSNESGRRDRLQAALARWLARLVPGDDLAEALELSADYPIALLPVKIQTRFLPVGRPRELFVRIYPDVIAADTHEPALTPTEVAAGSAYWTDGWKPEDEPEAWRALLRRFPATRAAWIVRETTPTNLATRPTGSPSIGQTADRPAAWTRPAEARLLPDRWLVVAFRGGGEVRRALSEPVREPLALSPDPAEYDETRLVDVSGDGLALDPELVWMVDFAAAEKAGMAVRLPVDATDVAEGFEQLVVVGVKASLEPDEAGKRLGELLAGHHYGRGLAFVPQGTPTNNTAERPAGWPPQDEGGRASFTLEREGLAVEQASDGKRFATAIGVAGRLVDELPHLSGADLAGDRAARAMNDALWPITWGYHLEQMLAPGFGQAAIDDVHRYFSAYVRGRGPYPAVRVGETPYGVLPVSSLAAWAPAAGANAPEALLPSALSVLQELWRRQTDAVARITGGGDPDAELLDVLAMDASAREVRLRDVWGADFIGNLFTFYGYDFFQLTVDDWDKWKLRRQAVAAQVRALLTAVGRPPPPLAADPRIARVGLKKNSYRYGFPLVTDDPLSDTEPLRSTLLPLTPQLNYIDWIRGASWMELRKPFGGERPPLLFLLLKHALLVQYASNALEIRIANGLATNAERREPELVGVPIGAAGTPRPPIWDRFSAPVPALTGALPLGDFLIKGGEPETKASDACRDALRLLAPLPTGELERLLTETLDVCSHRIDAWITSLATQRLEAMRLANPEGCHLGAFGFVEDLRPLVADAVEERSLDGGTVYLQRGSGGYVHAPSLTHAATASVLRSGYLNRAGEAQKPFALNLSSTRVRDALWLLDAVRQGQPLGAILGYRFERRLHERSVEDSALNLEQFIQPLRDRYPLVAGKGFAGVAASTATAARNVVDGLALWRRRDESPFDGLSATPSGAQLAAMEEELRRIDISLDACADLLVAESVHELVRGSTSGAGASLEAMAEGKRPPEPEVAIAPRGGPTLTHRVAVVLGGAQAPSAGPAWPTDPTPRAEAEEHLDGWIGAILGNPASVRCRVSVAGRQEEIVTLSDLTADREGRTLLRAIDVLALAAESSPGAGAAELDRRVADAFIAKHGLTTEPSEVEITYTPDPDWDRATTRSFLDVLEVARALGRVIGGSRPLEPADLLPPERKGDADAIDTADLQARADRALEALGEEISNVDAIVERARDADTLLAPLRAATLYGIPGAFPASRDVGALRAQAASTLRELKKRQDAAVAAQDPGAALAAIFGRGFAFLPRFIPAAATAAELDLALGAGSTLVPDTDATRKWFQQAARVRPPLGRWRRLALYAAALGADLLTLDVAQLPFTDGAQWAALPFSGTPPQNAPLSLVLHRIDQPKAADPWVGLLLDEWSEVIPRATEQTGVAFDYDDAGTEAPNAVLLAVPPDPTATTWDPATLLAIVRETLELAKLRAVEGDLLGEVGQVLPAILLASNAAGDTVETTFNASPGAGPLRVGDFIV
jgi:hypothetical protein